MSVSRREITVRGRAHPAGRGCTIEAESSVPRALPTLVLMCLGVVTLPFTLGASESWVVGVPVALMMAAGARLLTADSRYRVVLCGPGRRTTLFESGDERLVIALTAALRSALEDA